MGSSHPAAIAATADWSNWEQFTAENVARVPPSPGVYLFRQRAGRVTVPAVTGSGLVYVGRAGERNGRGVRERLRIYVSGRAPHSGLGNLALERALADANWLRSRLARVEAGERMSLQAWARDAVAWADLEFSYAVADDAATAATLEVATIAALHEHALWNRRR